MKMSWTGNSNLRGCSSKAKQNWIFWSENTNSKQTHQSESTIELLQSFKFHKLKNDINKKLEDHKGFKETQEKNSSSPCMLCGCGRRESMCVNVCLDFVRDILKNFPTLCWVGERVETVGIQDFLVLHSIHCFVASYLSSQNTQMTKYHSLIFTK